MGRKKKDDVKKEILAFLNSEDGAYFGNLVMELNEDALTLLEHLIELKRQGMVYKDNDGGKFKLYESKSSEPDDDKDRLSSVNEKENNEKNLLNRRLFMPILSMRRI
jgi:DNA-binding transcriptional ArsR family regulator